MGGSNTGAVSGSLNTSATVGAGTLAASGVSMPSEKEMLTAQADAIIERYTQDGVIDVVSLVKDANQAKRQADAIGQKFEAKLHDPNISQKDRTEAAQKTLMAHQMAEIAEAAATKATQTDKKIDQVITSFAEGGEITMDTLEALEKNAKTVHATATATIGACAKILNDPKAAPADVEGAKKAIRKANAIDDVAVGAFGKALAVYQAGNPETQGQGQVQGQAQVQSQGQEQAQY